MPSFQEHESPSFQEGPFSFCSKSGQGTVSCQSEEILVDITPTSVQSEEEVKEGDGEVTKRLNWI